MGRQFRHQTLAAAASRHGHCCRPKDALPACSHRPPVPPRFIPLDQGSPQGCAWVLVAVQWHSLHLDVFQLDNFHSLDAVQGLCYRSIALLSTTERIQEFIPALRLVVLKIWKETLNQNKASKLRHCAGTWRLFVKPLPHTRRSGWQRVLGPNHPDMIECKEYMDKRDVK